MKIVQLYKFLSYILIPFGALFGILSIVGLLVALSNPPMLFGMFLIICCVLYIFSSFSFFNKVVIRQQKAKTSFKDFIKVNAFVTIAFAVYSIVEAFMALYNHQNLALMAQQMQLVYKNNFSVSVDKNYLIKMLKGTYIFTVILFSIILLHGFITIKLVKQYTQNFQ